MIGRVNHSTISNLSEHKISLSAIIWNRNSTYIHLYNMWAENKHNQLFRENANDLRFKI